MYSARMVNLLSDAAVVAETPEQSRSVNALLPARECVLPGVGGVLTNRAGDFDLQGRDAWIFISIKNRGFNRP